MTAAHDLTALADEIENFEEVVLRAHDGPEWSDRRRLTDAEQETIISALRFAASQPDREAVAFITKSGLENWLQGDGPENHVLLRTGGDLRVALYMHPPEPTNELTGCREALRKATIKNTKSDAIIADLNDMVLRYAHRAEASADPADAWEIVQAWLAQYEDEEKTFSRYRDDVILDGVMSAGLRRALTSLLSGAGTKSVQEETQTAKHTSGGTEAPRTETTFGWVIEAGWTPASAPDYWCGTEGEGDGLLHHWNKDSFRAIRFARKIDAERIARCIVDGDSEQPLAWRVAEHGWNEAPSDPGTKSAPQIAASHNSGERDPSVMPDYRGADTKSDGEDSVPKSLLNERDDFIVSRGLWSDFVATLDTPSDPSPGHDVREALEAARQAIEYSLDMGGADPAGVLLQALNRCDAALSALTRPLGGFVQGSIGTKQSTDPEGSSRTETAGWKLVPVRPTLEMQKAYFNEIDRNMHRVETDMRFGRFDNHRAAYQKMIEAVPAVAETDADAQRDDGLLRFWLIPPPPNTEH